MCSQLENSKPLSAERLIEEVRSLIFRDLINGKLIFDSQKVSFSLLHFSFVKETENDSDSEVLTELSEKILLATSIPVNMSTVYWCITLTILVLER